jgi:DNA-binding NarL/FixJ family response regulator
MPEMNGIDATIKLNQEYPEVKIIILTTHKEDEFVFDLMTKGAHGFLPKDKSVEEVIDAIYAVMEKGKYYNDEIMEIMMKGSRGYVKSLEQASLSQKEIEIIKKICQQKTNKEIAEELGLSIRTIENNRTIILEKTNTKNVAGIVMYALKHKIISRLEMM